MVDLLVRVKAAGAHPQEGDAVPVGLVHVGLDLEDEGGEEVVQGADLPLAAVAGEGRGGHAEKVLQEGLHAEGGQSRAEKDGGELAVAYPVQVKVAGGPVQQLDVLDELVPPGLAQHVGEDGVVQVDLGGAGLFGVGVGGEVDDLPLVPIIHPQKVLAGADGPVDGVGLDAQFLFDLLAQLEGVPGLPVHLIDEGEDGNVPHDADLEELASLGLHALGPVDDHDGGVGGHEGAVGVLGEVLVAGGVQNVDAETVVLELEHRGGHGDAALFLDLHPVGHSGPGILLALDLAGLGDGPAVEQELFRQGGLAGVGVGDDGKRPPALDFGFVL